MLRVDEAILDTNKAICKNISKFDASERGLLSQNILAQLRNFVEYIVQKIYSKGVDTDPNDYKDKKAAWEYVKTRGELRFLSKFHNLLQKSVSHYTFDEGGSERLMLKYYEYLIKIQSFLRKNYKMIVQLTRSQAVLTQTKKMYAIGFVQQDRIQNIGKTFIKKE